MPGIDLNLDLPAADDTMADFRAKTAVALSAIEDDLAAKVTPAELDINDDLSLEGNSLTEVRGLQLASGLAGSVPGTVVFYGDEFYLYTASGVVQVTSGGALDASSIGGFTGMGGTNAVAAFDLASGEFRFTEDTGDYADLVCEDLVLTGEAGTIRLSVDPAMTTRTINIASLPASGISLLAYKASTSTLEDATTVGTVTGDLALSVVTSTTLTVSSALKHTFERGKHVKLLAGAALSGSFTQWPSAIIATAAPSVYEVELDLETGDRLQSVVVKHTKGDTVSTTFNLYRLSALGAITETTTEASTTSGAGTVTLTPAAPTALTEGERYYLRYTAVAVSDRVTGAVQKWDRP